MEEGKYVSKSDFDYYRSLMDKEKVKERTDRLCQLGFIFDGQYMIKDIKSYKILAGQRGKKYDTAALSKILLKVSKLLEKNENIIELDINPIMALQKGAVAVDARIVVEQKN